MPDIPLTPPNGSKGTEFELPHLATKRQRYTLQKPDLHVGRSLPTDDLILDDVVEGDFAQDDRVKVVLEGDYWNRRGVIVEIISILGDPRPFYLVSLDETGYEQPVQKTFAANALAPIRVNTVSNLLIEGVLENDGEGRLFISDPVNERSLYIDSLELGTSLRLLELHREEV
jgi:hypothetical protein